MSFRRLIKVLLLALFGSRALGESRGRALASSACSSRPLFFDEWRGGAKSVKTDEQETYLLLADAVRSRLNRDNDKPLPEIADMVKAFKALSSAQQTFKNLDGVAHETYQRLQTVDEVDVSVSGRARRSAARAGATADALGDCELCELLDFPSRFDLDASNPNGTLFGREVLLNTSFAVEAMGSFVRVLVLYEDSYRGGAGVYHGGIDELSAENLEKTLSVPRMVRGRVVVVVGDGLSRSLGAILALLEKKPQYVRLKNGLVTNEVASVQSALYNAAVTILTELEPILRLHNESAIHFVGRSIGGGIASLSATIFDGGLPMPSEKKSKRRRKKSSTEDDTESNSASNTTITPLQGLGKRRSSALTLGAPPSMSSNVPSEFVISIVFGDDIVTRTSPESIERFLQRTRRSMRACGILGIAQLSRIADTFSLATSNLKSHAHGSEGEEARLSIPGRAFLVRPRRLSHACSMHEIGAHLKGGREAIRAVVLWQLNDILLSKSLWKHHQLESYIIGLDRVHLRGVEGDIDGS
jgi:hypothetical protein